jgi:hypothetical protein
VRRAITTHFRARPGTRTRQTHAHGSHKRTTEPNRGRPTDAQTHAHDQTPKLGSNARDSIARPTRPRCRFHVETPVPISNVKQTCFPGNQREIPVVALRPDPTSVRPRPRSTSDPDKTPRTFLNIACLPPTPYRPPPPALRCAYPLYTLSDLNLRPGPHTESGEAPSHVGHCPFIVYIVHVAQTHDGDPLPCTLRPTPHAHHDKP